jgi:hypothetical protein
MLLFYQVATTLSLTTCDKLYNSFVCGNESFAVINLRGVSTNKTIICFIAMQTYKELMTNC